VNATARPCGEGGDSWISSTAGRKSNSLPWRRAPGVSRCASSHEIRQISTCRPRASIRGCTVRWSPWHHRPNTGACNACSQTKPTTAPIARKSPASARAACSATHPTIPNASRNGAPPHAARRPCVPRCCGASVGPVGGAAVSFGALCFRSSMCLSLRA
jgi:hypothetical protein